MYVPASEIVGNPSLLYKENFTMETKRIKINDTKNINDEELKEAAQILRDGGLVAFPTETVYGLGGNALDEKAAGKIYAAKGGLQIIL